MSRENNISDELRNMGSKLGDLPRSMPYSIPSAYSKNSAADTQKIIKHIGEAEEVPAWGKAMPYAVPGAYFENFAATVQNAIRELDEPETAWTKEMPFSVPAGYFENLAENIISDVNSKNAFPGLTTDIPYQIPAGYFEALPAQILAAAKASEPLKKAPKVIPFKPTYSIRSVIKWAAAAILLICIGFGGFFFFQQPCLILIKF